MLIACKFVCVSGDSFQEVDTSNGTRHSGHTAAADQLMNQLLLLTNYSSCMNTASCRLLKMYSCVDVHIKMPMSMSTFWQRKCAQHQCWTKIQYKFYTMQSCQGTLWVVCEAYVAC